MKRLPQRLTGTVAPISARVSAAGLCLGLYLTISIVPARADVRYTTETQMGNPAEAGNGRDSKDQKDKNNAAAKMPALRTTTFVRGKKQRVETVIDMGTMKSTTVSLTLCDTRRIITMDPDLKIYTVDPMDGGLVGDGATAAAPDKSAESNPSNKKPDTGHVISTYNIQDLGTEKVNNINARHFMVTMRIQRSGCAGKGDSTMKMETWVAPGELGGLDCEERVPSAVPRTLPNEKGCQITFETKGDTGLLGNVFRGIVVRQRIYNGDKVAMTQEVKDIVSDPLTDTLFAPPADYRQVKPQEYADAKSKAMMTAFKASSSAPQSAASDGTAPNTGASGTTSGTTGEAAPEPPKRRRGVLGGLGGSLGGVLGGTVSRAGTVVSLGSIGGNVLSALGGERGLGGIASLLGSGMLGGSRIYSPISLPGSAGEVLRLLGALPTR